MRDLDQAIAAQLGEYAVDRHPGRSQQLGKFLLRTRQLEPHLGSRCGLLQQPGRQPGLYTQPPPGATVICADELGPVTPRTFPPAPGWSPDGHRVKDRLEYSRGTDKTWVYGALRIRDGTELTFCAPSCNSDGWIQLLAQIGKANRRGPIVATATDPPP